MGVVKSGRGSGGRIPVVVCVVDGYLCRARFNTISHSGRIQDFRTDRPDNAGTVAIGGMVRRPNLEQCGRIYYLDDYGDEWYSYAILEIRPRRRARCYGTTRTTVHQLGGRAGKFDAGGLENHP